MNRQQKNTEAAWKFIDGLPIARGGGYDKASACYEQISGEECGGADWRNRMPNGMVSVQIT